MGRVFLYSDVTEAFEETSAPFVAAAGGRAARLAWLVASPTGWEPFLAGCRDPWLRLGAAEVVPILPAGDPPAFPAAMLDELQRCTGVFVCGGDTRRYHALCVRGPAGAILRGRCREGLPYAGLSAGALIAPARCIVWGDRVTSLANRCCLRGADDGCDAELQLAEGLGLLRDCLIEPHFSERGGFPRLVTAMDRAPVRHGLGLDDPTCVEVRDGAEIEVHGRGRAYRLRRERPGRFRVQLLEPGTRCRLD